MFAVSSSVVHSDRPWPVIAGAHGDVGAIDSLVMPAQIGTEALVPEWNNDINYMSLVDDKSGLDTDLSFLCEDNPDTASCSAAVHSAIVDQHAFSFGVDGKHFSPAITITPIKYREGISSLTSKASAETDKDRSAPRQRRKKIRVPDELKDEIYWRKRMQNNKAAKLSRERRKRSNCGETAEEKISGLVSALNELRGLVESRRRAYATR